MAKKIALAVARPGYEKCKRHFTFLAFEVVFRVSAVAGLGIPVTALA